MRATTHQLVGEFDAAIPLEDAVTPPKSWYLRPELFDHEIDVLFRRSWLPVGRAAAVEQPGAFLTGSLLGNPYVVVRGFDGRMRAFHNVCSHHGAEVMSAPAGEACQLRCGYHGWTYRLDGTLWRIPGAARLGNFDATQLGLTPIAHDSWGPLIFLRLAGDADAKDTAPIATHAEPLRHLLEPPALEQLTWLERREYVIECNWKIFIENALDGGYHVPHVHRRLCDGLDMDAYETRIENRTVIQICPTHGADDRLGKQVTYSWLFPNLFLNRYGDMLDTNIVLPLGPRRCVVIFDWFADLTTKPDVDIANGIAHSDEVQREDVRVCESVQRGLASETYDRGRYAPAYEAAVHTFHVLLQEVLHS